MRCAICGGELVHRLVEEEISENNDRIVVKVEAEVCENCRERYYADGIVDKLIDLKERLKKHKVKMHEIGKVYESV